MSTQPNALLEPKDAPIAFNAAHWRAVDAAMEAFEAYGAPCLLLATPGLGVEAVLRKAAGEDVVLWLDGSAEPAALSQAIETLGKTAAGRRPIALRLPSKKAFSDSELQFLDDLAARVGARLAFFADHMLGGALGSGAMSALPHFQLRPHGRDEVRAHLRKLARDKDAADDGIREALEAAYEMSGGSPELIARISEALEIGPDAPLTIDAMRSAIARIDGGQSSGCAELNAAATDAAAFCDMPEDDLEDAAEDVPDEEPVVSPVEEDPTSEQAANAEPPDETKVVQGGGGLFAPSAPEVAPEPKSPLDPIEQRRRAMLWRSRQRRVFNAIGLTAACLGIGGLLVMFAPSLFQQESVALQETPSEARDVDSLVATALAEADRRKSAGRFTAPEGDSAYDVLLWGEQRSPGDPRIHAALADLATYYAAKARDALKQGDFERFHRFNEIADRIRAREAL